MLKDCKLPQFSVFRGVSHASEADIKKVVVWVFFVRIADLGFFKLE